MPSMEAMACDTALVTFDTGGCRDYARDGETALVARRRDVADLGAKLERMAVDAELRARIAGEGMAFVRTALNWDNAARRSDCERPEGRLAANAAGKAFLVLAGYKGVEKGARDKSRRLWRGR